MSAMLECSGVKPEWLIPIGYRRDGRPIWSIFGGAPDDDEGDTIEDDEDEPEDEEEDTEEEEEPEEDKTKKPAAKKAPAKKAAPTKTTGPGYETALARERASRKAAERQLRELRRKTESDAERASREADEAAEAKYKPAAKRAAARAALAEAKVKGDISRAVRLIDLDAVDVDDDGEVIGLDQQVAELKKDYPELFEQPAKRVPRPKVDGAGKRPPTTEPKTSAEKIAAMYGME